MNGPQPWQAALLTVGSELTTGQIADTNAQWAAAELSRIGYDVVLGLTVDDDRAAIRDALDLARARAGLVWITGGLGPTEDDLTVETVAGALGRDLVEDPATIERLRGFAARRGTELSVYARRMARVPAGAEALPNPVGSAPGIWIELDGGRLVLLPGVPSEMKGIATASVLPRLAALGRPMASRVFRCAGVTEGEVDQKVRDLWAGLGEGERFALQLARGEVLLRVWIAAADRAAAQARLDGLDAAVRARLGDAVLGPDDEDLAGHVVGRLRRGGRTVAVAESATGGLVAARLTAVPGASAVVRGGWVTYQPGAKAEWLGIDPALLADGAVGAPVTRALAAAARERGRADFGLGVTGWAGPDGGTAEDPVGTVYLAVTGPAGTRDERRWFRGPRDLVRELAVSALLELLRRSL